MRPLLRLSPSLLLLAACTDASPRLAVPQVTTLPSGIVEVKNTGPSAWVDTTGWKLVELYRLGGAAAEGTPGELVYPRSMAFGADGGLYLMDSKPSVIKQFSPTGVYVRSIGREGSGPGEFKWADIATAPGLLVVHDGSAARVSVFDSAGQFLRSWNSASGYQGNIHVSREGIVAVPFWHDRLGLRHPGEAYYVRTLLDGSLVDTMHIAGPEGIGEPKTWTVDIGDGQTNSIPVPFAPAVWVALDPAGGAVLGWSGTYRFFATRTGLDTTQVVTLKTDPVTVSDARRSHVRDSIVDSYVEWKVPRNIAEAAMTLSEVPSTAPYFESLAVDGGRNRWLRWDDGGILAAARFNVFDSTGAYLGAVPVPKPFGKPGYSKWGTDRVATMMADPDGVPLIIIYGIERRRP